MFSYQPGGEPPSFHTVLASFVSDEGLPFADVLTADDIQQACDDAGVDFADGCVLEFSAPQIVAIEPGHDAWVVGEEPAVLIEFDFEGETCNLLGMAEIHSHNGRDEA